MLDFIKIMKEAGFPDGQGDKTSPAWDPSRKEVYDKAYRTYRELYDSLKHMMVRQ